MENRVVEKQAEFYLGREHDLKTGETFADRPLLYKAKDLTTHAMVVGMTGSGKTGLCLGLLEEAGIDGIPAIIVDPKGDISNLLLTFPQMRPADFEAWVDAEEAKRQGLDVGALAEKEAAKWTSGLEKWGQGLDRVAAFRDRVNLSVFTPGSTQGRPLTVLRNLDCPPDPVVQDGEAFEEYVSATVSGLLGLLKIKADPASSREHILLSKILFDQWQAGNSLRLDQLVKLIFNPPFRQVGALDLDSFFSEKERTELGMSVNNLIASPSFANWRKGEPLDVQNLLYDENGKPNISILSIAHLDDSERMFFVTLLLNEILAWTRKQSGTSSLRAIFYMDEVFGYFPPIANPPSKRPMLTLLKQARAFGLGVLLATQNPVDLDYKGLSNMGTWFLGRLQTERDKMRVIEGLEGAAASNGAAFSRQEMEEILAGVGARKFLLNNVHNDGHKIFETRWALSYLRGPIASSQIAALNAQHGSPFQAWVETEPAAAAIGVVLPAGISEKFVQPNRTPRGAVVYKPALIGHAAAKYKNPKSTGTSSLKFSRQVFLNQLIADDDWSAGAEVEGLEFSAQHPGSKLNSLPPEIADAANMKRWGEKLEQWIGAQTRCAFYAAEVKTASDVFSSSPESKATQKRAFAQSLLNQVKEQRSSDLAKEIAKLEDKQRKAKIKFDKESSQASQRWWDAIMSFLQTGFAMLMAVAGGRKVGSVTNMRGMGSAAKKYGKISAEKADVANAQEELDRVTEELEAQQEHLAAAEKLTAAEIETQLEEISVEPTSVDVETIQQIVWFPYEVDASSGFPEALFKTVK